MTTKKFSAKEIFQSLIDYEIRKYGHSDIHIPTDEQIAIIESDPFSPSVVIAGAGSGKTETMGARVLWLVANGHVRPDQILGLTFTRKAAAELALRIRRRLRLLSHTQLLPTDQSGQQMDLAVPVSTYHSYAGKILAEHGIRLGIDTGNDPIGEAATWQIINDIVQNFENPEFELTHTAGTIVDRVAKLAAQIGEHASSTREVLEHDRKMLQVFSNVPPTNDEIRDFFTALQERISILPMIDQLFEYRLANGTLSFNDQMSLAAELAVSFPVISQMEKDKYRIVLLDEYQDTSYSQVRFLSHLFGDGHPVTAVGDPNQAIYGWRSASPETMGNFSRHFPTSTGAPVLTYPLLTTWRNDKQILQLANHVITELSLAQGKTSHVRKLELRPGAGAGRLTTALFPTLFEEAQYVAQQIEVFWNNPERLAMPEASRSTCAILVRAKSQIPELELALRDLGLPVEVIGLGGLLHTPEVADIIALLRILTFADAGSSLMRLLSGPHVALGAKDLAALGRFARSLISDPQDSHGKTLEAVLVGDIDVGAMEAEDFPIGSIIEALEVIDEAPIEKFSPDGLRRLKKFAKELQNLRRNINGSIIDAITEAEHFLGVDIEVLVRDGWERGHRNIDQFLDEASKFAQSGGTLSNFLRWLEVVEAEEAGFKIESVEVSHNAIQILTIHQAKGAEWDFVVVPGLANANFPNRGKGIEIWTKSSAALPFSLRGDADQFTDFVFPKEVAPKSSVVGKALKDFENQEKTRRYHEELRLAYVAFTRAKKELLCTTSWFRQATKPASPSVLLEWAADLEKQLNPGLEPVTCEEPDGKNPLKENPKTGIWPSRSHWQDVVLASAQLMESVTEADIEQLLADSNSRTAEEISLLRDAQALIQEHQNRNNSQLIYLPNRLSVSSLMALAKDPAEVALNIRRPMPGHIDKYARRGTAFHLWLERRFTAPVLISDDDLFGSEGDDDIPLIELQEKWLASSWADKTPVAVEVPFETVLSGVLLRGRIDAVYQIDDQYQVVDWKTGREKSGDDLQTAAIQLATYRLAYSKMFGVPLEKISAAFYYVGSDSTVAIADLFTEEQLIQIISGISVSE